MNVNSLLGHQQNNDNRTYYNSAPNMWQAKMA